VNSNFVHSQARAAYAADSGCSKDAVTCTLDLCTNPGLMSGIAVDGSGSASLGLGAAALLLPLLALWM
jgi:hypothetical protein